MKKIIQGALLAVSLSMTSLAFAQPNMEGVWVQVGDAVGARSGSTDSGHHSNDNKGAYRYTDQYPVQWQLEVSEQKGRALHAKWCSDSNCESVVGAFRGNGDLLLVDEDGLFIGSVDAGVLELCYLEAGENHQVASCREFKKQ